MILSGFHISNIEFVLMFIILLIILIIVTIPDMFDKFQDNIYRIIFSFIMLNSHNGTIQYKDENYIVRVWSNCLYICHTIFHNLRIELVKKGII